MTVLPLALLTLISAALAEAETARPSAAAYAMETEPVLFCEPPMEPALAAPA